VQRNTQTIDALGHGQQCWHRVVNAEKYYRSTFALRRGECISNVPTLKYLGPTLDRRLTWLNQADLRLRQLLRLIGRRPKLRQNQKLRDTPVWHGKYFKPSKNTAILEQMSIVSDAHPYDENARKKIESVYQKVGTTIYFSSFKRLYIYLHIPTSFGVSTESLWAGTVDMIYSLLLDVSKLMHSEGVEAGLKLW